MRRSAPLSNVCCAAVRSWRREAATTTTASGTPDPYAGRAPIAGVAHVVAVASGKGGVGKSTLACNLAVAATASGLRVGLLDGDIYGPSVPLLMGLPNKPPLLQRGTDLMVPPVGHGVACMSMALLLKPGASAAWRGPMVMGALQVRGTTAPSASQQPLIMSDR
jgi:ATP-binding protein involved in chromosome partitioning